MTATQFYKYAMWETELRAFKFVCFTFLFRLPFKIILRYGSPSMLVAFNFAIQTGPLRENI